MATSPRPVPVPTSLSPVLLHYRDVRGQAQFTTPDAAASVPFEQVLPIRDIPRYPNQEHTPGLYWSATGGEHLAYESYLECQWMTLLDFDPQVVAMSAQPLRIQGLDSQGSWEHTPDLFVRLSDGTGRIVDVKSPIRVNDADTQLQTARTRALCTLIGFDYVMLAEPPAVPWLNVSWLAAYRRPFDLPGGLEGRVLTQAADPVRIGDLVAAFDVPGLARTAVLRACWFGRLSFDLQSPLRDSSLVHTTREAS